VKINMINTEKFYQLYLRERVILDDIDDYIEQWHTGDSKDEIYEFLGMSQEVYRLWVETNCLPKTKNDEGGFTYETIQL